MSRELVRLGAQHTACLWSRVVCKGKKIKPDGDAGRRRIPRCSFERAALAPVDVGESATPRYSGMMHPHGQTVVEAGRGVTARETLMASAASSRAMAGPEAFEREILATAVAAPRRRRLKSRGKTCGCPSRS